MIYKIHHLHCGSFCPLCAPLFGQTGLKAHFVCHCLLLETDRGLVLVDTGLGIQDYLHSKKRLGKLIHYFAAIVPDQHLSAFHQIQQLGFKPNDVRHILVTHLDFDHAGGIADFPNATVHILSNEFNAAQTLSAKNKLRYRPQQFQQHAYWHFLEHAVGETWFNFHRVQGFNIFKDEILMIPLLGHTAGHCGIAIKQQEGYLLFCGDAYYSHLELNPKYRVWGLNWAEQLLAFDNQQRLQSLQALQTLAQTQPQIEIICAHDPLDLKKYQI